VFQGIRRLIEAIENGGGDLEPLLAALKSRQKRHRELQGALAELEGTAPSGRREAAEIEAELRGYLADWQGLLRGQTVQARQMIRKLLGPERFVFTPDEDNDGRFYTYEGRVDRMQLIRGTVRARAMVTPGRFVPFAPRPQTIRGVVRIA
jgi:hypothetical protein